MQYFSVLSSATAIARSSAVRAATAAVLTLAVDDSNAMEALTIAVFAAARFARETGISLDGARTRVTGDTALQQDISRIPREHSLGVLPVHFSGPCTLRLVPAISSVGLVPQRYSALRPTKCFHIGRATVHLLKQAVRPVGSTVLETRWLSSVKSLLGFSVPLSVHTSRWNFFAGDVIRTR